MVWFGKNSEPEFKTINEWKRLWSEEWKRLWSEEWKRLWSANTVTQSLKTVTQGRYRAARAAKKILFKTAEKLKTKNIRTVAHIGPKYTSAFAQEQSKNTLRNVPTTAGHYFCTSFTRFASFTNFTWSPVLSF